MGSKSPLLLGSFFTFTFKALKQFGKAKKDQTTVGDNENLPVNFHLYVQPVLSQPLLSAALHQVEVCEPPTTVRRLQLYKPAGRPGLQSTSFQLLLGT